MKHKKIDGKKFGGNNLRRLNKVCENKGFISKVWGTYQQWIRNGRFVEFGSKGSVVFGKNDNGKYYHYIVFNMEQTRILSDIQYVQK